MAGQGTLRQFLGDLWMCPTCGYSIRTRWMHKEVLKELIQPCGKGPYEPYSHWPAQDSR